MGYNAIYKVNSDGTGTEYANNGVGNNALKSSDVKDNLTSTDTDKPLSANQGKVLKGLVDNKQAKLSTAQTNAVNSGITSTLVNKIGTKVVVSSTAPSDTSVLWVDTSS